MSAAEAFPRCSADPVETLLDRCTVTAEEQTRAIGTAVAYLVHLMREAHGGAWRSVVDHQVGLVMIIPAADRSRSRRTTGRAV